MIYYRNLSAWLNFLDSRDYLNRIKRPIDKDAELHLLVRLQFRGLPESERKGWLFESVTDSRGSKYEMPVALAVMAPNRMIYALEPVAPCSGVASLRYR